MKRRGADNIFVSDFNKRGRHENDFFCFCECEEKSGAKEYCDCFNLTIDDNLFEQEDIPVAVVPEPEFKLKEKIIQEQIAPSASHDFLLTVPGKIEHEAAPQQGTPERRSSSGGVCARYSKTEEKALVHAKLRLQIGGFVGFDDGADKLVDYYEYYLQQLAPDNYLSFPKRETSALVRKYKAIKSKDPKLISLLDPNIESKFWHNLIELVTHKPLLHPVFYAGRNN